MSPDRHLYCLGCGIHSNVCPCFRDPFAVMGIVCSGECPGTSHQPVSAAEALSGPVATRVADSIKRQRFLNGVSEHARRYRARKPRLGYRRSSAA